MDTSPGYHIDWAWTSSSTQNYAEELEDAIATWNDLSAVDIDEYTLFSTKDLEIEELYLPTEPYVGQYAYSSDKITMNTFFLNTYPTSLV